MDRRQFLSLATVPCYRPIFDFGQRVVLLHKYTDIEAHFQGRNPDCTAHASAVAVEVLNAIEHILFNAPLPRKVRVAYLHNKATMPGQEGAAVEDAIAVLKKGFLWRTEPYKYNPRKRDWPSPDARIKTAQRITSFAQAANAIKSLQPIIISSSVSFKGARLDEDGFIRPSRKSNWGHAWCMIGVDDRFRRPGGLLLSSWGPNWPEGVGSRHNQPRGSAWVDASVLDQMLSRYGKSYAISDLEVLPQRGNKGTDRRIIFYSSPTCQPCQIYKPVIAKFPEIITREANHSVSPVPQVWIIKNGQVVDTLVGLQTESKLRAFLQ